MSPHFNKWTHFALVSDGKDGDFQGIYLDGELFLGYDGNNSNALPSDGTIDTVHGLFLGCWPYWTLCFRGYIDEFRIWNKSLTKEEINLIKNSKVATPRSNLYLYYNCYWC